MDIQQMLGSRPEISPEYTICGVQDLVNHHGDLPVPLLRNMWDQHLNSAKQDKYTGGLKPAGCEPIFCINSKAVLLHVLMHDRDTYELLVALVKRGSPDPTAYTFNNTTKLMESAGRRFTPDQAHKFWDDHHDKLPVNALTLATVFTTNSELTPRGDVPYDPVTNPIHPRASWDSLLRALVLEYEDMWDEYKYLLEPRSKPKNGKPILSQS